MYLTMQVREPPVQPVNPPTVQLIVKYVVAIANDHHVWVFDGIGANLTKTKQVVYDLLQTHTVWVPVDPLTAMMMGMVTPEEINAPEAVVGYLKLTKML